MMKPVESLILPGMESAVEANHLSAAALTVEELSAEFKKPLGSVAIATGEMELRSPLFYGTYHPTLF